MNPLRSDWIDLTEAGMGPDKALGFNLLCNIGPNCFIAQRSFTEAVEEVLYIEGRSSADDRDFALAMNELYCLIGCLDKVTDRERLIHFTNIDEVMVDRCSFF